MIPGTPTTQLTSGDSRPVLVRAADAEILGVTLTTIQLPADGDPASEAVSAQQGRQGYGRAPRYHTGSAEIFFIIEGGHHVLAGERVITVGQGDVLLVPRNTPHAFCAPWRHGRGHAVPHARGRALRGLPARRLNSARQGEHTAARRSPGPVRQPPPGQSRLAALSRHRQQHRLTDVAAGCGRPWKPSATGCYRLGVIVAPPYNMR